MASSCLLNQEGERIERPEHTITWSPAMAEKAGYKHFMQKEIFEQPRALIDTFRGRIDPDLGEVMLQEITLSDEAIIARGAFLHDVGKMAIPDAILRKPDRLSPEEQEIMRQHAQLGYRMLRRIPFLREAADIVYSHQERFDGSGYPRGLKGDQIPLGARIFAIADTFDAITSDRPYRAAQSISAGRREIERNSGRQFDPDIVEVFLSISEQIWQDLRTEIGVATPR